MRICFARSREEGAMLARYQELAAMWERVVASVQSDANNREQDETAQMTVRDTYRNGIGGLPVDPLAYTAGNWNTQW